RITADDSLRCEYGRRIKESGRHEQCQQAHDVLRALRQPIPPALDPELRSSPARLLWFPRHLVDHLRYAEVGPVGIGRILQSLLAGDACGRDILPKYIVEIEYV